MGREDLWLTELQFASNRLGTIGDSQSFDVLASGTLLGMFDFDRNYGDDRSADSRKLILDPTSREVVDH